MPELEDSHMTIGDLLSIRWRERAGLLSYIEGIIRSDGRVSAAWVSGSTARGEDDALSDLDLYIVVADNAIDDFVDNRRVHAARPARPVLLMENLANAPTGGAYLLALYEGEAGPQHVDWFWLPESEARLPDQATVLFDRAGLSRESSTSGTMHRPSGPPLGPNPPLADLLEHKIAFFWAMSVIVAKHIARRNGETVARMTRVVAGTLVEAAALCGCSVSPPEGRGAMVADLEAASAQVQLQVLREFAGHADALGGRLADRGVAIPTEAVRQVRQFFKLAEALATRDACLLRSPAGPHRQLDLR